MPFRHLAADFQGKDGQQVLEEFPGNFLFVRLMSLSNGLNGSIGYKYTMYELLTIKAHCATMVENLKSDKTVTERIHEHCRKERTFRYQKATYGPDHIPFQKKKTNYIT